MQQKPLTRAQLEYLNTVYARMPEILKIDPVILIKFPKDDTEYKLEFDIRACIGLLKDTKFNCLITPITLDRLTEPEFLAQVLYWGLKRNHPNLTLDWVMSAVNVRYYRYYVDRAADAVRLILPDVPVPTEDEEKKEGDEADGSREENPM